MKRLLSVPTLIATLFVTAGMAAVLVSVRGAFEIGSSAGELLCDTLVLTLLVTLFGLYSEMTKVVVKK